ncbi:response regulator receiver domain [Acinetobacter pittii]|uniref:response regulator receiver domain n=1 Tax=Acinetobacter pittii TaxID=48296 RepID=UPI00062A90E8|nr:response regulator receiver domain [Acinetobacter pittii]TGU86145.1 hypothetical protein YA64_014015 [Acinetobacter pittii]
MTSLIHPDNFFEFSRQVAQKFIQSVVAVDDEMEFSARPPLLADTEELIIPEASEFGMNTNENMQEKKLSTIQINNPHKLYYQDLSFEFAEKAIICSGLKPYPEEDKTINAILRSSINSDITILDWQMEKDGDSGRITTKVIKKIIEDDIKNRGRLRLFVIYTAADQASILHTLETTLSEQEPVVLNGYIDFKKPELKLCRICIISKRTTEKDLSDEVIRLFTELTVGILSNAALASITEMRDNTHNILYKFNKNLDPAYLSHVLGLISSPDMREQAHEVAFDYAVDLISEEIKSELQTSQTVKKSLNKQALSQWPLYINPKDNKQKFRIKVGNYKPVFLKNERVSRLLTVSNDSLKEVLDEQPTFPTHEKFNTVDTFKKLPIQFSIDGESLEAHLALSVLQCVRRDSTTVWDKAQYSPVLKSGVVLESNQDFYICIQPICDTVRLKGVNNLTFIKVKKGGSKFSHVLRENTTEYIKLDVNPSSKLICVMPFEACSTLKMVKGSLNGSNYIFTDNNGNEYVWYGELKQAIYQEIINNVSASLARVGTDSFEWLRLKKA